MKDKFKPHYRQYHTANSTPEDMQIAKDQQKQAQRKQVCAQPQHVLFDRASTY